MSGWSGQRGTAGQSSPPRHGHHRALSRPLLALKSGRRVPSVSLLGRRVLCCWVIGLWPLTLLSLVLLPCPGHGDAPKYLLVKFSSLLFFAHPSNSVFSSPSHLLPFILMSVVLPCVCDTLSAPVTLEVHTDPDLSRALSPSASPDVGLSGGPGQAPRPPSGPLSGSLLLAPWSRTGWWPCGLASPSPQMPTVHEAVKQGAHPRVPA